MTSFYSLCLVRIDGLQIEGTFHAHQIPLLVDNEHPEYLKILKDWMKSYKAEELFDKEGPLTSALVDLASKGGRRMGANPHTNGGLVLKDLIMTDFRKYAVKVSAPGSVEVSTAHTLGVFLSDVASLNKAQRNFRIFGLGEKLSNRLNAVFEATNRQCEARTKDKGEFLATYDRVMEALASARGGWKVAC